MAFLRVLRVSVVSACMLTGRVDNRGFQRKAALWAGNTRAAERRAQELVLGLPQGLRVQVLRVLLGLVLVLAEQVLLAGQDRLRAVELLVDHPWNSPLIMLMS